ncbi:MAG: hypothetical protein J0H60_26005, partial [Rhizobiales bacterium]|nr:hypothetical protein [Hyphomicrobiales bacterium]
TVRDGKIVHLLEYCDTMMYETAMFDKVLVPAENEEDMALEVKARPTCLPAGIDEFGFQGKPIENSGASRPARSVSVRT